MARDLKELVVELDVIKSWFSPGSARHGKIAALADEVAEHAGGRVEAQSGDPNLATPGPGVKSPTAQVTEVDSVGDVADASVDPAEQRRAAAAAAAEAAKQQREQDQKQPNS